MSSDSLPPPEKAPSEDDKSFDSGTADEGVKTLGGYKSKLDFNQRALFGFNTVEESEALLQSEVDKTGKKRAANKTKKVVYGVDDDDDYDSDDQDDSDEDAHEVQVEADKGGTWEGTWLKEAKGGN